MSIQIEHFLNEETSATEVQLRELENIIGHALPEDYRLFLQRNNGGAPVVNVFFINKAQGSSIIDLLHGFYDKEYWIYDIRNYHGALEIPKEYWIIGHDPGGNRVCIGVVKENYGKIYFWDHERPEPDNIYLIANSFTEFMEGLQPYTG